MPVHARNTVSPMNNGRMTFRQGAAGETLYWVFAAASGCLYLGAAACLVWIIRGWLPLSFQPSLAVHRAQMLALKGGMFDFISRIVRRCGRDEVFVRRNVHALRWIGGLAIVSAVDPVRSARQFLSKFTEGWRSGAGGDGQMPTDALGALHASALDLWSSLALIALPFVLAWVFHRGVALQGELEEVV